ncbi:MAG: hypothetical protein OQL06_02530 [Gammaproteobacteria bacterium]|nr:hypothetical protein [Gammaproteobacteria bacterium]
MKNTLISTLAGLVSLLILSTAAEANLLADDAAAYNMNQQIAWTSSPADEYLNHDNFFQLSHTDEISGLWSFDMLTAGSHDTLSGVSFFSAALSETNMARVPVPTAAWLFASGLIGLIGISRRKSKPGQSRA